MSSINAAPMLRLVQNNRPSEELVETLSYLLQEALAGRITGLAYGALMPSREFIVDAVGEAHSDALRGIGLAQAVSRTLSERLMG